ncbi:MAG: dCTP deaminase, partial [Planctomycetaceae bacterium]|nr:dCTP deaminase [Planctomycetaceae bacterium]
FILHPRQFVLAVTLEWIRLPSNLAGYVVGRSSWGRHGLIIATATGVHPGFTGCLTLELTNVGEIPITIKPGTTICQVFLHTVDVRDPKRVDLSRFIGNRKPTIGAIQLDDVAVKLARKFS